MNVKRALDFVIGVPLIAAGTPIASRAPTFPIDQIKRILVIKLAAAGDALVLIPILRNLRRRFPHARIDWMVSSVNKVIAQAVPYVDRRWVWKMTPGSTFSAWHAMKDTQYDLVIDFEQWARGTALLSRLSGAPLRFGFDTPGQYRSGLYTHSLKKTFRHHEREDFAALLAPLSIPWDDKELEFWETYEGKQEALRFVAGRMKDHQYAVLHPGCGADGKPREWPLEFYAEIGRELEKTHGLTCVLTGGPEETQKTRRLNEQMARSGVDAGGKLSWMGLASVLKKAALVISGNTGVMHLAAAFKTPQIALHGPTDERIWGPLNPKARIVTSPCPQCPCLKLGFEYHTVTDQCMRLISPQRVKAALSDLLGNH